VTSNTNIHKRKYATRTWLYPEVLQFDRTQLKVTGVRRVYIVDHHGNLDRVVSVYLPFEAYNRGIDFHADWRRSLVNNDLKPKDFILADDGYVVRVKRIETRSIMPNHVTLTLTTGSVMVDKRCLPTECVYVAPYGNKPKKAPWVHYQKLENWFKFVALIMRCGWNVREAIKAEGARAGADSKRRMLGDAEFREFLMGQIVKFFKEADIEVGRFFKAWLGKIESDGASLAEVNEAVALLARIHPDLEDKAYQAKTAGGGGSNLFLGDPMFVNNQQNVLPPPLSPTEIVNVEETKQISTPSSPEEKAAALVDNMRTVIRKGKRQ
jgi:hypothetical protein